MTKDKKKIRVEVVVPGEEDSNTVRSLGEEGFDELDRDVYIVAEEVFEKMEEIKIYQGIVKTSFTYTPKKGSDRYFQLDLYLDKTRNKVVITKFKELNVDEFIDLGLQTSKEMGGIELDIENKSKQA